MISEKQQSICATADDDKQERAACEDKNRPSFTQSGFEQNQSFARLRHEEPARYYTVKSAYEAERAKLIDRLQSCQGQAQAEVHRELWVLTGVLEHDLDKGLL